MNHFRIEVDQADSHVHFRLLVNGGLASKLCMRLLEYFSFKDSLRPDKIPAVSFTFHDEPALLEWKRRQT